MNRREFITLVGGAVAAWALTARAQRPTAPVIGYLHGGVSLDGSPSLSAFRQGLSEMGYVEGRSLTIEYRMAKGDYDRLPAMATELVHFPVAVLVAITPVAALAAKQATMTIPIVFSLGSDPVKDGLVASLNRPGGNITGATFFANLLTKKRLGLLHELVPNGKVFAMLVNAKNANVELETKEAQEAARALGLRVDLLEAQTDNEIDNSFEHLVEQHADGLLVSGDAVFLLRRHRILELAARYRTPTCFAYREQAAAGGLLSYGASISDTNHLVGSYVGRILNGEKPADLPVLQPAKFDFVINMKVAKELGLNVPNSMQLLADEVIE